MVRISNEKLLTLLAGLSSIYLYFSGLGQYFQVVAYLKYIVYPLCYLFGIVAYIRTFKIKRNFIIFWAFVLIVLINFTLNMNFSKYAIITTSADTVFLSDILLLLFISIPGFFLSMKDLKTEVLLSDFTRMGVLVCSLFTVYFVLVAFIYRIAFDYMNITYGVLPWLLFVLAFSFHSKKKLLLVLSIVDVVLILISGCRGAALTTLVFLFLVILWYIKDNFDYKKLLLVFVLLSGLIVVMLNFDTIMMSAYTSLSALGFKSRSLELYLGLGYEQGLGHYNDRAVFQTVMIDNINLFGHGLYSDRSIATPGVYAHNVILEWLIDFGIIFGTPLVIFFLYITIKNLFLLFRTNSHSTMVMIAMCISILCCKYMFSSSYLHAPEFWIVFGIYISIQENSLKEKDNNTILLDSRKAMDSREYGRIL